MDRNESEVARLNEQIADLKAELVYLSGQVNSGTEDVGRTARPAMALVRDNPGTVSSVAVTAGFAGLLIGYLIGSARRSSWY